MFPLGVISASISPDPWHSSPSHQTSACPLSLHPRTLSLFLLPKSSILSILCPVHSLSLICTCANYLSSLTLSLNAQLVSLIYFFPALFILFTPSENRSMLNSTCTSTSPGSQSFNNFVNLHNSPISSWCGSSVLSLCSY